MKESRNWRDQDNPRRAIEELGAAAALQQAITRTASYPYHNPNKTDILIPTRSSAICGCEESRITASYRAAGRRGSRVPNRQVMSLRARPLSYIGENANSCIKSSFGNGYFFFCFSVHPHTGNSHLLLFAFVTNSLISLQGYSTEGVCWNIIYYSVFVPVFYTIIYYCYPICYIWVADSVTLLTVCSHVVASRLSYSNTQSPWRSTQAFLLEDGAIFQIRKCILTCCLV
jgi:hypothetical protein